MCGVGGTGQVGQGVKPSGKSDTGAGWSEGSGLAPRGWGSDQAVH